MSLPLPSKTLLNALSRNSVRRRGFALVIVLGALVLILAVTVGVLSLAGRERRATMLYAGAEDSSRMVQRVVEIVQSQINAATTEGTASNPVSWASQPGMVRTFQGAGPSRIYKLYSWEEMNREATGFTGDSIPDDWAAQPAVFTDLNEPVSGVFPIVDPAADALGFQITNAPGASPENPAPMPVKWLYVLKDGSLVTGSPNGANASVPGANRGDKEIVARVAFWTDDETSKVNINTASEGLHWDAPRVDGGRERDMGRFQPVRFEVQRFPGHPAGVSLSEVFPQANFELANYAAATWTPLLSGALQDRAQRVANIAPRVTFGGSLAAYAATTNPSSVQDPIVQGASSLAGTRQISAPDADRFYATVDELIFDPARTPQAGNFLAASSANLTSQIQQRGFFLTAHSVAPETTLFETPKVSLWPIRAGANLNASPSLTNRADAYDKMIALASSLPAVGGGRDKYYFQRENPLSNNELGGIPRNAQLYNYLKSLTGRAVPGFSESIASSLGSANRNSVLVQTFDMIRAGVNLMEGGLVGFSPDNTQVRSFAYPGSMDGSWNTLAGTNSVGHVQATMHDGVRGIGTVPYITRVGVGLYCERLEILDASGNLTTTAPAQLRYTLRPAVLVEAFSPVNPWGARKQFRIAARIESASGLEFTAQAPGGGGSGGWISSKAGDTAQRGAQSIGPAMDVGTGLSGFSSPHLFLVRPTSSSAVAKTEPGLWGGSFQVTFPIPTTGSPAAPIANINALLDRIQAGDPAGWGHKIQMAAGALEVSLLDAQGNPYHRASVNLEATPPVTVPHFGSQATNPGSGANTPRPTLITTVGQHTANYLFEDRHKIARTRQDGWIANDGDFVVAKEIGASSRFGGDFRLSALTSVLVADDFEYPVPPTGMRRHSFARGVDSPVSLNSGDSARPLAGQSFPSRAIADNAQQPTSLGLFRTISSGVNGVGGSGDYAMDLPGQSLGSAVAPAMEGGVGRVNSAATGANFRSGYRDSGLNEWAIAGTGALPNRDQAELTFSPNRQVFSPIQIAGGVMRRAADLRPWETLLFSANPASGSHPGIGSDHLFADLFWMPIVDPYPISETFSTAGKVNLNARLEPFGSYITRETALRAALKAIGVPVVDGSVTTAVRNIRKYAFADTSTGGTPNNWDIEMRDVGWTRPLNLDQTLQGIRNYGFFRSATEVCNVPLVPDGTTLANYASFWNDPGRRHTPDNLREQPYAHAYARLTTRSNTFTVHYRVQVLKKVPGTPDAQWVENRDQVLAEYRGKSLIERYLDPNAEYPDYATNTNATPMTRFYKWRTLSSTRFAP